VTYNVASGVAVPIRDVLAHLLTQASRPLRVFLDPDRLRPVDVPRMVGDASRLREDTGWTPRSCWQDAANAALQHWRGAIR
jgi:GDP-4-dehydro-6-deoxy-D-mannose reductase